MQSVSSGDTAFVLMSAALVMLMTPGVALFYAGMVRSKNVLNTIMLSFATLGVVSVLWGVVGYSLAFGPDVGGVLGSLAWLGLAGVGQTPNADYAASIPHLAFVIFQGMFAAITPALITGALVDRVRFRPFMAFVVLWSLLVYSPIAHWVWGTGGWLRALGALDFAGGTVVHVNAGAAALAGAVVLGKRRGLGTEELVPHNLPVTVLGAALLWFGWFGFNAGSALAANGLATSAFVVTNTAAAAAALAWMGLEWLHRGQPTTLGAATGCVAGLVAITPASGFVSPMPALAIGLIAGTVCYAAVLLKWRLGYDDALDVVGVHGVGGFAGALLTGVFASRLVNPSGADGLIYGNPSALLVQLVGVLATLAFSFVVSYALFRLVDTLFGLRASREEEQTGLDLSQHSEVGYTIRWASSQQTK